jgi:hypothetical protein
MNYAKPEIAILGDATSRIQGSNKRAPHQIDPGLPDEVASSYETED